MAGDTLSHGGSQAAAQLLRQLGVAFSTYRLYPGDLAQPALVAAVERVEEAAAAAVADGAVAVAVRSGRFHLGALAVDDDRADRLADACFQRRVERLEVRQPPTLAEVDALFDALVRSPEEVEAAGGVGALLAARGVRSLAASEGAPDPFTGRADPEHDLAVEERPDPEAPPERADALPPLTAQPGETAQHLYERLRGVSDALPEDVAARSGFFRRAAALAGELEEPERSTFGGLVLDRAGSEAFAERYVGHLTDVQLAGLIAAVARARGHDPVALAGETATVTDRHGALVRLVEDAVVRAADPAAGPARTAVADLPGEQALQEGWRLREGFPAGSDDGRQLALTALRDYLRAEPDPQQLEQVAAAAAEQLRADVRDRAPGRIRDLLGVLEAAATHLPHGVRPVLATPRRAALDPAVLVDVAGDTVAGDREPGGTGDGVPALLEPFGTAAVDALVDALADEPRRTVRGLLVGLLASLVADHPARLEPHLAHPRWYVARNVAAVLRRIGGAAVVPLLERLATHEHGAVRQEARHGLAGLPPDHAAPVLARLAVTYRQREEREECLQALARFASPDATRLLEELASRRARPRLPWGLRRQARSLARRAAQ